MTELSKGSYSFFHSYRTFFGNFSSSTRFPRRRAVISSIEYIGGVAIQTNKQFHYFIEKLNHQTFLCIVVTVRMFDTSSMDSR